MSKLDDYARYERACHAMQSGVMHDQQTTNSQDGTPKHLRVGINCRAVEHGTLIRLLIAKGIITEEEYVSTLADDMEKEVKRYEDMLEKKLGAPVKLI